MHSAHWNLLFKLLTLLQSHKGYYFDSKNKEKKSRDEAMHIHQIICITRDISANITWREERTTSNLLRQADILPMPKRPIICIIRSFPHSYKYIQLIRNLYSIKTISFNSLLIPLYYFIITPVGKSQNVVFEQYH